MTRMLRIMLCALFMLTAAAARAQTAHANLSKSRVYVGDELIYSVIIENGNAQALPSVDFPDSVTAEFSGQSQQATVSSEIVGGQRRQVRVNQIVYAFRVRANRPGSVTIPPATVTLSNGDTITTPAARFEALLPEPSTDFIVTVSVPRSTVYVGETVRATVAWIVTQNVDDWSFDTTPLPPSFRIAPSESPPAAPSGRLTEFRWFGQRAYASVEQVFAPGGGSQIQLQFHLLLTPLEPGMHTLGPLRVVFDRYSGRSAFTRAYAESDPLTLTVEPLPTEGRPAGYSGLIGDYSLRTMATPTTANVGDPITLRAELTGAEPMTGADALPDLGTIPALGDQFRVSAEGWTEERPRERGRRVFTTTLRALSDEVKSIPPITLHTFDPEEGAYRPVGSDPIQLDIRAVREATIADAVIAPGARPPAPGETSRPTLSPADPAFWAPPTADQIRAAAPFDLRTTLASPPAIAVLTIGPATLLASGFVFVARRRATDPRHRRRRVLRRAEHLAVREGPAAGVRAAIAEMLNADPGAVAAVDADRLNAHPGVKRTLREALAPSESLASELVTPKDAGLAIRSLRRGLGSSERGAAR